MNAILNIGLHVNGQLKLTRSDVFRQIWPTGRIISKYRTAQSASEPTLVIEIDRPLSANEGS